MPKSKHIMFVGPKGTSRQNVDTDGRGSEFAVTSATVQFRSKRHVETIITILHHLFMTIVPICHATSVNRYLFTHRRFHLLCLIAALLLSATGAPAATVTVANGNDSGPGSLRQAILSASPGDAINFAPAVTAVILNSGELVIDKNLTITGPGPNYLTVQASNARVFHISSSTVTVSISGMTIAGGSAPYPGGGGILSAGVSTLTDCTIANNSAFSDFGLQGGGGVMNDNGTMTITGCTISNNAEAGGNGGGVLNENGTMTITGCTISNNSASGLAFALIYTSSGGGISNDSGGSLNITNSTVSGNTCSAEGAIDFFANPSAAFGGGIENSGSMTITNSTISGNSAVATGPASTDTGYGGGISNGGDLQITSSTIVHNSTMGDIGLGGGINGFNPTRIDSSIIALNNSSTKGPDYFTDSGALQSTGYNLVGNNADAVINSKPTDQIGTPAAPIDPLLAPLADNGGSTLTHALQPGSRAINRGDPGAPPQDQRGYGRSGVPDVGAFEFSGVAPTILGNISTRSFVQTGDNVMIGGFIVQGPATKKVIIRAIGPELTRYGVPNPLFNPTLELHDGSGALIASNDNWTTTIIGGIITSNQVEEIRNSGHAPKDGRESAIIADLPPGNYTAIVRGVDGMTGVALVEVYDISGNAISTLGNISTRSFVQTGDNVMIGGFIVQGTRPKKVILRAIGRELTQHGVPDALADPALELHDSTGGLIASNNNWQQTIIGGIITSDQRADIRNSGHAPTDTRESAVIATLQPGNYTAIIRGVNNTTGVALVEVYDLNE